MGKRILLDTGPLVAVLNRQDPYHAACVATFKRLTATSLTTWPVLVEAAYLLQSRSLRARELLDLFIGESLFQLLPIPDEWLPDIRDRVSQYANLPLDVADASLMVASEKLSIDDVLTLDGRHFGAVRRVDGRFFRIVPIEGE